MHIYKITCQVNANKYIGQTIQNPNARWRQHRNDWKRNDHVNPHMQNAYNLYGPGAFTFEVIASLPGCSQATLDLLEMLMIVVHKPEYNIRGGGSRGAHSESTKKKIGKANKGKPSNTWTPEMREALRIAQTGRAKSESTRQKLSRANKGQAAWNKGGKQSPDWIEKKRQSLLGHPVSEDTRAKISATLRARNKKENQ